jgi:AraC-like DNA-binding protein
VVPGAAARPLDVVRHRSPLGEWEYVFADPAPALAGLVRRYCAYRERTPGPLRRRELPGAQVVLIVDLGPALRVHHRDRPGRSTRHEGGFAAGLDDGFTLVETAGEMRGVQVDLTLLGARRLLGREVAALAGEVVSLADLAAPSLRALGERLGNLEGWAERFAALDELLAAAAAQAAPAPRWLGWAAERILAASGRVEVSALARQAGYSRKHVAETFRAELGMTPRRLARLVRFERLLAELRAAPRDADWTCAALAHGYYDQAHFVREFRAFAGLTPGELRRRLRPDLGGVVEPEPGAASPR